MKIGDHVHIGANSVVEAATIGSHVEIGKNCVIVSITAVNCNRSISRQTQGKFCIIKDCAKIADNSVLLPNSVVPALAHFAGHPGMGFQIYAVLIASHSSTFLQANSSKTSPSQRRKSSKPTQSSSTTASRPLRRIDVLGVLSRTIPLH